MNEVCRFVHGPTAHDRREDLMRFIHWQKTRMYVCVSSPSPSLYVFIHAHFLTTRIHLIWRLCEEVYIRAVVRDFFLWFGHGEKVTQVLVQLWSRGQTRRWPLLLPNPLLPRLRVLYYVQVFAFLFVLVDRFSSSFAPWSVRSPKYLILRSDIMQWERMCSTGVGLLFALWSSRQPLGSSPSDHKLPARSSVPSNFRFRAQPARCYSR